MKISGMVLTVTVLGLLLLAVDHFIIAGKVEDVLRARADYVEHSMFKTPQGYDCLVARGGKGSGGGGDGADGAVCWGPDGGTVGGGGGGGGKQKAVLGTGKDLGEVMKEGGSK